MGEMEINPGGGAGGAGSNETEPAKPVQNENIKPEEPSKIEAPSNAKKFFNTNNETSQPNHHINVLLLYLGIVPAFGH